jgi:succinyl-CoA synthetase beta subunit
VVGARHDETFGPIVVVGLGGLSAEVLGDVAIRSAPVDPRTAGDMVDDLLAVELIDGYRGTPPADRGDLGGIIEALGRLVVAGRVAEIEINPLRVTADGLIALDAVVVPSLANERGPQ